MTARKFSLAVRIVPSILNAMTAWEQFKAARVAAASWAFDTNISTHPDTKTGAAKLNQQPRAVPHPLTALQHEGQKLNSKYNGAAGVHGR